MNCESFYPLLSGHIDGENTEAEEAQLQEHLAVCPHCRALLEQWMHTDTLLAQTPAPPADLTARIMQQLPKKRRRRGLFYFAAPAATLATAAVLALAVFGATKLPIFAKSSEQYGAPSNGSMMERVDLADNGLWFSAMDQSGEEAGPTCKSSPTVADTEAYSGGLSDAPVMIVWYTDDDPTLFEDLTPALTLSAGKESGTFLTDSLFSVFPADSDLTTAVMDTLSSAASDITVYVPAYGEMPDLIDRCTASCEVAVYYPAEFSSACDSFVLLALTSP